MEKHTKIYLDFFDVSYSVETSEYEPIKCEYCECRIVIDVHHIFNKQMGGSDLKDFIENLIGLCRVCHNDAHDEIISKDELIRVHQLKMKMAVLHKSLYS